MSIRGSGSRSTSDSGGSQASGLRQRLEAFKDEFPDHSEVVDAFLEFDDDDDGFIATVEIRRYCAACLNPTVDELTAMTRVVLDVNNSGKVNYFDFLNMMIRNDEGAEKRLQEMLDEENADAGSPLGAGQISGHPGTGEFSWDDAHEEDGVIADEYGSEAGEPGVVKAWQVHGNNPVTLACANAVMKHYVSQGNMKGVEVVWKYPEAELGNGDGDIQHDP